MADAQTPVPINPVQAAPIPATPPVLPAIVVRVTKIPPNIQQMISDGIKYGPASVYMHRRRPSKHD